MKKLWSKFTLKTKIIIFVVMVAILAVATIVVYKKVKDELNKESINAGTIVDYVKEAKFTGAKFTYDGVAYTNDGDIAIRYYANVRANVDFEKIEIPELDEETKKINVIVPNVELEATIDDSKSLDYMPSNPGISLNDAIKICQDDAKEESNASEALVLLAKENVEKTIKALLQPIVEKEGYEVNIIWNSTEGGNNE